MAEHSGADLFWPGADRAGEVCTAPALLASMVEVERAWLAALVSTGVAPVDADDDLADLIGPEDESTVAHDAEATGNPASPLVTLLRARVEGRNPIAARWLHRGLTSQDVVDTALVLQTREAAARIRTDLLGQAAALVRMVEEHRATPMVATTLTQPAVPSTFGLRAASWLAGTLDALDRIDHLRFPAQLGGAAGTRAASVELAAALPDPVGAATGLADATASALGLDPAGPWHTVRTPFLDAADAMLRCTGACGHLANDVLLLGRPEIGGVRETSGGGSSTMPQKANPVAAVLVRRAALEAPHLLATLHVAAASFIDERPDGAWHAEWSALSALARRTVATASLTRQIVEGLVVRPDRLAAALEAALPGALAEQGTMAELAGHAPGDDYTGTTGHQIDAVLTRARSHLEELR